MARIPRGGEQLFWLPPRSYLVFSGDRRCRRLAAHFMARVAPRRSQLRACHRARTRTLDRVCLRLCSGLGTDLAIYDRDDVPAALRRSRSVPLDRFVGHERSSSIHSLCSVPLRAQCFRCLDLVHRDVRDLLHRGDSVRGNSDPIAALCFSCCISAAFRSSVRT